MAGSKRAHHGSIAGALGASYAALAASVGLVVVLTGGTGMARGSAVFMLGTLAIYFGRNAMISVAGVLTARRAYSLGADVRAALAALGHDFRVTRLSCDELDREDHVVVGPTGVFAISAMDGDRQAGASHRRLFPDGRSWWRDTIEDCHLEALRVGERLRRGVGYPVTVHPVLCLRSGLVTVGRVIRGVRVVHLQDLARTIADLPPTTELDARRIAIATDALTEVAPVIPLRPRARPSTDDAAPQLTSR